MSTKAYRKRLLSAGRFLALAAFLLFSIGPLLWIISTSLKSSDEIYTFPIKYIPFSKKGIRTHKKIL